MAAAKPTEPLESTRACHVCDGLLHHSSAPKSLMLWLWLSVAVAACLCLWLWQSVCGCGCPWLWLSVAVAVCGCGCLSVCVCGSLSVAVAVAVCGCGCGCLSVAVAVCLWLWLSTLQRASRLRETLDFKKRHSLTSVSSTRNTHFQNRVSSRLREMLLFVKNMPPVYAKH